MVATWSYCTVDPSLVHDPHSFANWRDFDNGNAAQLEC